VNKATLPTDAPKPSRTHGLRRLLALSALACSAALAKPPHEHILAGAQQSTDAGAADDLVDLVARPANVPIAAVASAGAVENVRRLASEPGARLAIVEADVYGAFVEHARAGDPAARAAVDRLRVFMPLFDEELHFVVRADSPLRYVHEIAGQHINVGPMGSGGAFTATRLYARMFSHALPAADASFMPDEEALTHLTGDRSVDVVAIVGGQPLPLLTGMSPQDGRSIRLLAVDPEAAETRAVAGAYAQTSIRRESYPDWLDQDVPALAVGTLLMTRDFRTPRIRSQLAVLAHAICRGRDRLRAKGHPKWREASFSALVLPAGWHYDATARQAFADCRASRPAQGQSGSVGP
jgi:TRAP-type uncharacterized transport system substrate-binding protein